MSPGARGGHISAALRIGLLGAAAIAPAALLRPARAVPDVEVTAVAARDPVRAERFAARYGIPRVHRGYAQLLADPEVDAVYIPLPNSMHVPWSIRALEAGKHVLCEKPMAANRAEAEAVACAADRAGLVVMEAMHYRHHPLAERMRTVARDELGPIRRVDVAMCVPLPLPGDIRYRYDLAGGAAMDTGCYALDAVRLLGGDEPRVLTAAATPLRADGRVDRAVTAELALPGGGSARVRASLWSRRLLAISARVDGADGSMRVTNFVLPHVFHRARVRTARGSRTERVAGEASYTAQLRAFRAAVRDGAPTPTSARHAVGTAALIDQVYRTAGLPLRRGLPD